MTAVSHNVSTTLCHCLLNQKSNANITHVIKSYFLWSAMVHTEGQQSASQWLYGQYLMKTKKALLVCKVVRMSISAVCGAILTVLLQLMVIILFPTQNGQKVLILLHTHTEGGRGRGREREREREQEHNVIFLKAVLNFYSRFGVKLDVCLIKKTRKKRLRYFLFFYILYTLLSLAGKFGLPYLDQAIAAPRAALPCACWVFSCFCNPLNSDMDHRILNVHT